GAIDPVETLENSLKVFVRDADAGVRDLDYGILSVGEPAHCDRSTFSRVFDGIVQKVVENLRKRFVIGHDLELIGTGLFREYQALGLGPILEPGQRRANGIAKRQWPNLQIFLS